MILSGVLGLIGFRYPYRFIHKEYILPLDRELFVMGDVSSKPDGNFIVTRPYGNLFKPSKPFIVSSLSEQELVESLDNTYEFS